MTSSTLPLCRSKNLYIPLGLIFGALNSVINLSGRYASAAIAA
jgi:hypothetical protein